MGASKAHIKFDPAKDILSLKGKVILVTGGNSGLGKQSIIEFGCHEPAQIWLAARDVKKAQIAARDIKDQIPNNGTKIELLELNLTSFASIRAADQTFSGRADRLDILMLNAGIMASAPGLTQDGYEVQFGTNQMGHTLLTELLLPILEETAAGTGTDGNAADVCVVVLSSGAHHARPDGGIDFGLLKMTAVKMMTYHRYAQSKLANILFARELAIRCPQLMVAAVNPGSVRTGSQRSMTGIPTVFRWIDHFASNWYKSVDEGVKHQLWAAISKDYVSGAYFEPVGLEGKAAPEGMDDELARRLWEWTLKEFSASAMLR